MTTGPVKISQTISSSPDTDLITGWIGVPLESLEDFRLRRALMLTGEGAERYSRQRMLALINVRAHNPTRRAQIEIALRFAVREEKPSRLRSKWFDATHVPATGFPVPDKK